MLASSYAIVVDPFCFRQFREKPESASYTTGTILDISVSEFEKIVNDKFGSSNGQQSPSTPLQDGYAPFCKHFFLPNDFSPQTLVPVVPVTKDNQHLLRTRYEARTPQELPVLTRYFPQPSAESSSLEDAVALPTATYFDLILYSREQIEKENQAQGGTSTSTAPWGIVSIKAQTVDFELPMNPITMMRNALGKEEGGSGVPLDRLKYMESVNYWKDHAVVQQ